MAYTTSTDAIASRGNAFSLLSLIAKPFNWLISVGENSARAQALNALANITDEKLAASGTTRMDEVKRILGSEAFL